MKGFIRNIAFLALLGFASNVVAQAPTGAPPKPVAQDTAIIFTSPRPLIDDPSIANSQLLNSWGFTGLFNDYGFGLGLYYSRILSDKLNLTIGLDIGAAKGANELGLFSEIKINRIYVMPLMANLNYRVLKEALGEGFRPYITAGAGPVMVLTTDAQKDFFSALGEPTVTATYGTNIGFGAYFGSDTKSSFSAAFRYYIIPYPDGIESTQGVYVTNFSGPTLSVSYGFNF